MSKQALIDAMIEVEGDYVDDPDDSGGETNYGITEAEARSWGYLGPMRELPRSVAFDIYSARYWDAVRADDLLELCPDIAAEVVDTGVNCGTARASEFLQRALNVLNRRGALYADLVADGQIGPATLSALAEYLAGRESSVLVRALDCLQGSFYIELAERREKDERFVYGWLRTRVGV